MDNLKVEMRNELVENIIAFWMKNMNDPRGGFLGRIDGNGRVVEGAPKGNILNARILWTFAAAYRMTGEKAYLDTAMRARNELIDRFMDKEFGGTFWSLDADGNPLDCRKQIYALAFTIYGLSELYRASGDKASLDAAVSLFRLIEQHSFDESKNGYLEAFSRDWSPIADMRLSDKDQNDAKTMNTHLHVLEAYTSLYRVWKDRFLGERLRNLIEIFLDRIVLADGHLALFFDEDWNVTSHVFSYGHDIECSWLLTEAAQVLGDQALLDRTVRQCARIAEASLEGWTPDGGMIYEKDLQTGEIDADRHWWVQAETVVGCCWQWKSSGDPQWLDRARSEWEYIKREIICPEGEWYWSRKADGKANTADDRAGFWKCPYHNGRMCMEIMSLQED